MDESEWLARVFESHRSHLWSVAYRMLGSGAEADDAVQEAWLRLSRADTSDVRNLAGWLTTVVGRVCLDRLRSRAARREDPLDGRVPDPVVTRDAGTDPEHEAELADSVGLALLVVLDTLPPAERLAFVLHDMFAVPFDEIARVVDRSPEAARQLASRGRRRVRGASPAGDAADPARRRRVVEAFLAAARDGDLDALVAVLDPDVVLRADLGPGESAVVRGPVAIASQAMMFASPDRKEYPVLVNGDPGIVVFKEGRAVSVLQFNVLDDRIVAIESIGDPERVLGLGLDLPALAANDAVLAYTEGGRSHSDLGGELERHAREAGLRVVAVGLGDFPSLVAAKENGLVVACALGMQRLGLRAGPEPLPGAGLEHRPASELGEGWWWVHPWDPTRPPGQDQAPELSAWFEAAATAPSG
jgi:RNA polymerase sigma factor (sigma-70 family)